MKHFLFAALLLAGFAGATLLGVTPSAATTVTIDFTGTARDSSAVSGSLVFDVGSVTNTPGDPADNTYIANSSSFSFTAHGATTTSTGPGGGSITFEAATAAGGHESFAADSFGDNGHLAFFVQTTSVGSTVPLLTLQTSPTSFTAWQAMFSNGVTSGGPSSLSLNSGSFLQFTVTSFNVSGIAVSPTPIPASVLMFGTALVGLACIAWFRRRAPIAA